MRWTRREFLFLAGGILTACGGINREPDYTIVIRHDTTFSPSSLVVPTRSLVAWHNHSDTVHTITADPATAPILEGGTLPSDAPPFDSGNLFPGDRWVYIFDVPGTYIYFSRYRQFEEMFGAVTVIA